MKSIFIGIDISKDSLDYAICTDLKKKPVVEKVNNTIAGIRKMIRNCTKANGNLWFCMEHTGNYGLLLAHQLQLSGLKYSMVSPLEIKRSMGITRGKTDKIDAVRIAQYAAVNAYKLKPFMLPSEDLMKLKSLMSYREQLVKIKTQLQNSFKAYKQADKISGLDYIIDDMKENIKVIVKKIANLEKEINRLIQSNQELNITFKKITSVKGIGLVIAGFMIVYTNNFMSFNDPRKFNCFSGLAPFEHSSGVSIRGKTKTSKLRNKTMKTLLRNGASSASNSDKELMKYYKRKELEGKPSRLIINNIACKLVYRAFAVVKREEPFVELAF